MLFCKILLPQIKNFGRAHIFHKSRRSQGLECVLRMRILLILLVKNINIIYQINEMNQNNIKTLKLLQKYWTWVTGKDWGTDESGIRIQVCTLKKRYFAANLNFKSARKMMVLFTNHNYTV